MKNNTHSRSLSYYTWQKFRKKKLAIAGLFFIGFAAVVSMLGYLITPDSSPDANTVIPELESKPPGYEVRFLKVHKNEDSHKVGFFAKMIFGETSDYRYIPINTYEFAGNDVVVETYTETLIKNGTKVHYNLADVVFPIDNMADTRRFINDTINGTMDFYTYGGKERVHKTVKELRAEVEDNNIFVNKFVLGSDRMGRDLLSRLMIGTRVSLLVGIVSVLISFFIGVLMGAMAGFFRGWVDDVIMWIINVVWSIPTLLLVIAITLALGKGLMQVFIAVGLTMWVEVARVVRGQTFSVREQEYVEAGRALGFTNMRLIIRHVLPNVMGPVIVISAANFANAILIEAGLSFLGLGAQPPTASWGEMITAHKQFIYSDHSYLAILPGVAIMLMVLAFMFVGNGLRDAIDTRTTDKEQVAAY